MELVKQSELIDQESAQDNQSDTLQTLDRDLTAPLEDVLEQSIERLNGFGAQLMKDTANLHNRSEGSYGYRIHQAGPRA